MTDLSYYDFIKYEVDFSIILLLKFYELNHKDHNFILLEKFKDNSGAIAECKNCKVKAHVNKFGGEFVFSGYFNIKNLTCDEIIIKNILE